MELIKWFRLLDKKAVSNKETIKSNDFQKWLIHIQAQRVITTNKLRN